MLVHQRVIVIKETSFRVGSLLGTIFPSCTFYWKTTLVSTSRTLICQMGMIPRLKQMGEKHFTKKTMRSNEGKNILQNNTDYYSKCTGQKKAISSRPAWRPRFCFQLHSPPGTPGTLGHPQLRSMHVGIVHGISFPEELDDCFPATPVEQKTFP